MSPIDIDIPAAWAVGYALALIRTSLFVIASPMLNRSIPSVGRVVFATATALPLATPVTDVVDTADLIGAALTNAAVGAVLGLLTGMLFAAFAVAGGLIDFSAALSVAAAFDPVTGEEGAVFGRMLSTVGLALVLVAGGARVMVAGLATSVAAVPLNGSLQMSSGLMATVTNLAGTVMVAGIQLALPLAATLFLVELVLAISSRFAPQANVFLVGLPVKLLVAVLGAPLLLVALPTTVDTIIDTMTAVTRALVTAAR